LTAQKAASILLTQRLRSTTQTQGNVMKVSFTGELLEVDRYQLGQVIEYALSVGITLTQYGMAADNNITRFYPTIALLAAAGF
jgi:hypothetical protein